MVKKKKDDELVVQTGQGGAMALPDYMKDADHGTDDLDKFVVPPRLQIMQKLSPDRLVDSFGVGAVVVMPQELLVAGMSPEKKGEPFFLIPLFFFAEWISWNPRATKGSLPVIRDRSLNISSEVARKARTRETWLEDCPECPGEGKSNKIQNSEHLNWVVMLINGHALEGTPMVLSLSRGDHRSGTNFSSLIKMRRAPMYACRFEAVVAERPNALGNWFGFDVTNPSLESGLAPMLGSDDETLFRILEEEHSRLKTAHQENLLRVDYEDVVDTSAPADTEY